MDFLTHPLVIGAALTVFSTLLGRVLILVDRQKESGDALKQQVNDVKGILVGPDGSNGVRGDLRELMLERKNELAMYRANREEDIRARAVMTTQIERLENDHRLLAKRLAALETQRMQYNPQSHRTQL